MRLDILEAKRVLDHKISESEALRQTQPSHHGTVKTKEWLLDQEHLEGLIGDVDQFNLNVQSYLRELRFLEGELLNNIKEKVYTFN
jgi:hypothetical protein